MNSPITLIQTNVFDRPCWAVLFQSNPSNAKSAELLALYSSLGAARAGYVESCHMFGAFEKARAEISLVAGDSTFQDFLWNKLVVSPPTPSGFEDALLFARAINETSKLRDEVTRLADELNEAIDELDDAELKAKKLQDRIDELEEQVELTTG